MNFFVYKPIVGFKYPDNLFVERIKIGIVDIGKIAEICHYEACFTG